MWAISHFITSKDNWIYVGYENKRDPNFGLDAGSAQVWMRGAGRKIIPENWDTLHTETHQWSKNQRVEVWVSKQKETLFKRRVDELTQEIIRMTKAKQKQK